MSTPQNRIPPPIQQDATRVAPPGDDNKNSFVKSLLAGVLNQVLPPDVLTFIARQVVGIDNYGMTPEENEVLARQKLRSQIPLKRPEEMGRFEQFLPSNVREMEEVRNAEVDRLVGIRESGVDTLSPRELNLFERYLPHDVLNELRERTLSSTVGTVLVDPEVGPLSMIEGHGLAKVGIGLAGKLKDAGFVMKVDNLMTDLASDILGDDEALKFLQSIIGDEGNAHYLQNLKSLYSKGVKLGDVNKVTGLEWDIGQSGGTFRYDTPDGKTIFMAPVEEADQAEWGKFLVSGQPDDRNLQTLDDVKTYLDEIGVIGQVESPYHVMTTHDGKFAVVDKYGKAVPNLPLFYTKEFAETYVKDAAIYSKGLTPTKVPKPKPQLVPAAHAPNNLWTYGDNYSISRDSDTGLHTIYYRGVENGGDLVTDKKFDTMQSTIAYLDDYIEAVTTGDIKPKSNVFSEVGDIPHDVPIPHKGHTIVFNNSTKDWDVLDPFGAKIHSSGFISDAKDYINKATTAITKSKHLDIPIGQSVDVAGDFQVIHGEDGKYYVFDKQKFEYTSDGYALDTIDEAYDVATNQFGNQQLLKTTAEPGEVITTGPNTWTFGKATIKYNPAESNFEIFNEDGVLQNTVDNFDEAIPIIHKYGMGPGNPYVNKATTSAKPKKSDPFITTYGGKNVKLDDNGYYYILDSEGKVEQGTSSFSSWDGVTKWIDNVTPKSWKSPHAPGTVGAQHEADVLDALFGNVGDPVPAGGSAYQPQFIEDSHGNQILKTELNQYLAPKEDMVGGWSLYSPQNGLLTGSPSFTSYDNAIDYLYDLKTKAGMVASTPSLTKPKPTNTLDTVLADDFIDNKVGRKEGSNEGGWYEITKGPLAGTRVYGKYPPGGDSQVRTEHLGNLIYNKYGMKRAPETKVVETEDGLMHISKYAGDEWKGNNTINDFTVAQANQVLEDFYIDIILGNWDVVSYNFDNILLNDNGLDIIKVDQGGSLLHKAAQGRKPEVALNTIAEDWDKFPTTQGYGKVMKKAGYDTFDAFIVDNPNVINKIERLPRDWNKFVNETYPDWNDADKTKVVDMLNNRTRELKLRVSNIPSFGDQEKIEETLLVKGKDYLDSNWPLWHKLMKVKGDNSELRDSFETIAHLDPDFNELKNAISTWSGSSHEMRGTIATLLDIQRDKYNIFDPSSEGAARLLINAISDETPNAPNLFRGIRGSDGMLKYGDLKVGDVTDMIPASFSASENTGFSFAQYVIFQLEPDSKSLRISNISSHPEAEWITGGVMEVVGVEDVISHNKNVRRIKVKQKEAYSVPD